MSITSEFDPARDGWYFSNWGECDHYLGSPEFTWELFRRTYLGVHPSQDPVSAPLDCLFYEIFKNCADQGNCGGMSLLGLALFKYGGYMGYCSPASFYTGGDYPDRTDLHEAINILQARQFSAPGIENFLDVVNAGNLSNAGAAFNKIKAQLGSGDYAVLSLADDMIGAAAHTVIPIELDEHPAGEPAGTKYIYVYDPNYPYDTDADYYLTGRNRVVIHSALDWEYHQGFYNGAEHGGTHYTGTPGDPGWCFAVPMSVVLPKARHPIAVDMLIEGLTELFVSGPGCAVGQIEDENGRRFYTAEADGHFRRNEIESDPAQRLADIGRWPWYARRSLVPPPGELYFLRRKPGSPDLHFTIYGGSYHLSYAQAGSLVEVQAHGGGRTRDVVRLAGVATQQQGLRLETSGSGRRYDIQQQRLLDKQAGWRSITLQNAQVSAGGVQIATAGDLDTCEVTGLEGALSYHLELRQFDGQHLAARPLGKHSAAAGRTVRFTPQDWRDLEKTEIKKKTFQRKG